jgi:hypothetical protein
MKCRNVFKRRQNQDIDFVLGAISTQPVYGRGGVRHVGGVTLTQALVRNMGTCRSDAKGETQASDTARVSVPIRSTGTDQRVVAVKFGNANGAKALEHSALCDGQPRMGGAVA